MANMTYEQKKEWAKLLFIRENLTQQEIADRVGASRVTVNKWIKEGNWENLKVSITITKEEQLKNLYRQLAELNKTISERTTGKYPTTAEADTITKLANAIQKMETDIGLSNIISAIAEFLKFLRGLDLEEAKRITPLLDAFIKSKL